MKLTLTLDEVSACAMALLSNYAGCPGNLPRVQPSGAGKNEAAPAGGHPYGHHGLRAGRLE